MPRVSWTVLAPTILLACANGNSEPSMQNSPPPSSTSAKTPIGPFTTLRGSAGDELPPGDASTPIVALSSADATWWVGDTATHATLADAGRVTGSRWLEGGKRLRVGLGTLDLDARSFAVEPALRPFVKDTIRLVGVAWFPDGKRVALLLDPPPLRVDKPAPHGYDRNTRDLVIVTLVGTAPPVRRTLTIEGTPIMTASDDRVIVAGNQTMLFDANGQPLAWPAALPAIARRVTFGAGVFVVVGADGTITLLEPRTGSALATWATPAGTLDAVAFPHGVAAIDVHGTVRIGCRAGATITQASEVSAGKAATNIQVLGDRLVVAADGPEPIRVATLTNPCQ